MRLVVKRIGENGQESQLTFELRSATSSTVNKIEIENDLTKARCDNGGIYSQFAGSKKFTRGNANVTVFFDACDFDDLSCEQILQILIDRSKQVKDAFSVKYPAINETASAIIAD